MDSVDIGDPQRRRVYAAEAGIPSHDLHTIDEVQRFLDEAMGIIGEAPIAVELVDLDDPRIPAEDLIEIAAERDRGRQPKCFGLAVPDERRILVVDAGQSILSNGLNVLHEAAHVLLPTPAEPHGPEFVRAWLDLLDRFGPYQLPAQILVTHLQDQRVRIADTPSRLAR